MRPIKFRAWDAKAKAMFSPSSICFKGTTVWVCDAHGENKLEYELVNENAHLMQFTGLVDRNDKDIYEGDIVWVVNGSEGKQIAEVVWDPERFCWHLKRGTIGNGWGLYQWRGEADDIQVIGNIYENPWLVAKTEATA